MKHRNKKYYYDGMEIGQIMEFDIRQEDLNVEYVQKNAFNGRKITGAVKKVTTIRNSANLWAKRKNNGRKFSALFDYDEAGNVSGISLVRIK